MTKDEALQMCLEYIETDAHERKHVRHAIQAALAQPVQEPIEWLTGCPECGMDSGCDCDTGTWNTPQPVQEPVARVSGVYGGRFTYEPINRAAILPVGMALYSAPPAQEPPSEWAGIKAILDEYGLQSIDFVADFKAALTGRERNFCQRCGKRTADLTTIHTCTPPRENT